MIVFSKERYLPTMINTIVLFKNDAYFYIHRDVYDQAIIVSDKYTFEELKTAVGVNGKLEEIVNWFYKAAPTPINILAPFISLTNLNIDKDLEECCGVLHTITAIINVKHFVNQPEELRKRVNFSYLVKTEYEMPWERFFMTAIKYSSSIQTIGNGMNNILKDHAMDNRDKNVNTGLSNTAVETGEAIKQETGQEEFQITDSEKEQTRRLLSF
ncbi:hypothetical protein [Cytobacillus sp. IB215316]|uniref:hypothetical protein n=1 Tax=Cytobacillus sp. IB215316 TaxID=3097354 RepID=UPI002A140B5B|nr:hypothetical protein [Cytobacillus sp. IB215316]MDX8360774.1 hypothetical protein [Cytobacillus sp. IB215316]